MKTEQVEKAGKYLLFLLVFIMIMRILGYYTLFIPSVAITRVLKIAIRFSVTGLSLGLLLYMKVKYEKYEFNYTNITGPIIYMVYALLSLASLLWSTNIVFSSLQLSMLLESIAFVWIYYHLQVIYFKCSDGEGSFSYILGTAIAISNIGFLIGWYVDPSTFFRDTHGGTVSRLGGLIINPNELGMLAVLGAGMAYVELQRNASLKRNGIFWVLNVIILLASQSRSSLIAFLLITGLYVLMSKNVRLQLASVVVGFFAIPVLINTIIVKAGDVSEVMSMTGRLPFWKDLITYGFPDRPLLGYGFMSIAPSSFTKKFNSIHAYAASMTHNTFVEVLITLGLVGAFIVFLQMVATFYTTFRSSHPDLKPLAIYMIIPLMINSITEFGIWGDSNYGVMFYQFVVVFFSVNVILKTKGTYYLKHLKNKKDSNPMIG